MKNIDKFYQHAYKEAMKKVKKGDDIFEIAGVYMGIAMRLYKTSLNEEDFNKMKDVITNIDVEPYTTKTFH
tara:strand:+ start:365 stop:577 length:213 start_codon:yes stop_codon:yes gene_type:complete